MSSRNARQGYAAEDRCRQELIANGYLVWRSGGSLTLADLIAAKPGEWLLVQVKSGGRLDHEWFNELYSMTALLSSGGHAGAYGHVYAIVADWPAKTKTRWGRMRLRRITGLHVEHKQGWPLADFLIDEVAGE